MKIIKELEKSLIEKEIANLVHLRSNIERIFQKSLVIINYLNELSNKKYFKLLKKYEEIEAQIKSQFNLALENSQNDSILEEIMKFIVPLNLVNPFSLDFNLENCQTLHDIIRFAQEKARGEVFYLGNHYEESENLAIPLQINIPIKILLLDLGGGFRESNLKIATPEDITSIPFKAVLEGMMSINWPKFRPIDIGGFLGMIAHTITISENELREMSKKSFCILTKNYINFSIRLGYHFSLIEAYISENTNDNCINYIKFLFRGGGASLDRRLRRVWIISKILSLLNFLIEVKNDVINALLMEYNKEAIEKRLRILGKLTGYTKQLDIVLFHDSIAKKYLNEFVNLYIKDQ